MSKLLLYRRPDYLNRPVGPIQATDCARFIERAKKTENTIPEDLSFDKIINRETCVPCSLNDFMNYLVYVEHNAENLQFYLWYKDYCTRFHALPEHEKALSPPFTQRSSEEEIFRNGEGFTRLKEKNSYASMRDNGPPSNREAGDTKTSDEFGMFFSQIRSPTKSDFSSVPSDADVTAQAGYNWQPFTIQPMREEINRVMRHYIAFTAPRELNLSHKDRALCLHALQHTTHPSALANVAWVAKAALRGQSHPNFVRWSISNGNKPRVLFARSAGASTIFLGFLIAVLLVLSARSRWWRIFAGVLWYMAFVTMICAYKGLCIILHMSHSRCLKPWEQSCDDQELFDAEAGGVGSLAATMQSRRQTGGMGYESSKRESSKDSDYGWKRTSGSTFGTFGPKNDDWENESWVGQYKRKNLVRRVFDSNVRIKNESLKLLQDRIVIGSCLWAAVATIPLTAIFVSLPKGGFY
ncbi:hypothetical protein HYFRA_00000531 [Hymenoscyphus fraxineus]|uniref:Regulator of G protein signaling superfamily n=1 Tax=Hymenoscyphus fraxineus TaxID=746836 RepID=A0A9N9L301_9HELO|nr:hypothetical protein HYFRA_00000531 [Hymenoscyphus fraxineus]